MLDSGEIVMDFWGYKGPKENITDRERHLTDVAIPASILRKGVNVVSIEAVRAPYDPSVAEYWAHRKEARELGEKELPYDFNWYTCEIRGVKLTAGSAAGLIPNATRPAGLQAWTSNVLSEDFSTDIGDQCDPARQVIIKGPRNGWSSGKVVIGSAKAIEGLEATCSDLKQGAAVIPASAIQARYAVPFADRPSARTALDTLLLKPLAKFPVCPGGGAVVPIWLTVKIPASAKAGTYTGQVTIKANGEKTMTVAVNLDVSDFLAPDTQNYRTWIELMQSPDTLAQEYNVPLWSDRHWDMIADSFRYIGEIGSRVVQIPLIAQTNSGNSESMVRFIQKPDGSYGYDLSILDKYLDIAVRNMGQPKFVTFNAWELYLATPKAEVKVRDPRGEDAWQAARWELRGKGPAVTAIDPATKKTSTIYLPRFEDPKALAIWKPLFDELHRDMAKRGLENTMLLGMASDIYPSKAELETLQKASGNLEWINHTHQGAAGSKGIINGIAKAAYIAYVWPNVFPSDPEKGRLYGWQRKELWVDFQRFTALNDWLLPAVKLFPELNITGKQRGIGRIGADFWPVLKDKRGERRGWVWSNYPQSLWHSCNLASHMLNPGPDGPVATPRYEALREGMQECEARIVIENALTTPALKARLGPELANKAQALLDDRIWQELKGFSGLQLTGRVYTTYLRYGFIFYYNAGGGAGSQWYAGSGWQDQAQALYAMAAEVQKKTGQK